MDVAVTAVARAQNRRALPVAQLLGASGMLELDLLRGGLRDLVRITTPRRQLGWIVDWLVQDGLLVHRWAFDMQANRESSLGGFSVSGKPIPADSAPGGSPVLFIARDAARFDKIDALALDDFWQGIALGYPRCCIEHFCTNAPGFVAGYGAYFAGHDGPFGCWANVLAEPFGHVLLSHLPCSPGCTESRTMAREAFGLLLGQAPALALATLAGMRRLMLYHADLGILSLTGERDERGWLIDGCAAFDTWRCVIEKDVVDPGALPEGSRILDFRGDL